MNQEQVVAALDRVNLSIDTRHVGDTSFSLVSFIGDQNNLTVTCVDDGPVTATIAEYANGTWHQVASVRLAGSAAEPITLAMMIDHLASTDWEEKE